MINTQKTNPKTVLIMAAGTGGHIFPAIAVADELTRRGAVVHWLGTPNGMENRLVKDYPMHHIAMQGIRGNGLMRKIKLPFMLFNATNHAKKVIKNNNIDILVGFGGYVSSAGGLAGKLAGKPLIIHEQNAICGMSNRTLARFADVVLQAFDNAFGGEFADKTLTVGNPVRADFGRVPAPDKRYDVTDKSPLKVLVVGGSLGASAINTAIVDLLKTKPNLIIKHQCGKDNFETVQNAYTQAGIDPQRATPLAFIDDMADAYAWADVVVCRAGALTVSEIASLGVAAIFIPLPTAVDDHQTFNAKSLTDNGAAILLPQSELSGEKLAQILNNLDREKCLTMAQKVREHAKNDAVEKVVDIVLGDKIKWM